MAWPHRPVQCHSVAVVHAPYSQQDAALPQTARSEALRSLVGDSGGFDTDVESRTGKLPCGESCAVNPVRLKG